MNDQVILRKVLNKIADSVSVDPEALFVERDAVFYHEADGSLRCACGIDTMFWNNLVAQVEAAELFRRLVGHP